MIEVSIYNQLEKEWKKENFNEVEKVASYIVNINWKDYLEIFVKVNNQVLYYINNEEDYGKLFKIYNAILREC